MVPNRWVATPKWVAEKWLWDREQLPQKFAEVSNIYILQVPALAGRAHDEKFFARQLNVESKHMNLTSSKIAKHADVLKLFASIALRIVRLQQSYDVTTHCCETLAQTLAMW